MVATIEVKSSLFNASFRRCYLQNIDLSWISEAGTPLFDRFYANVRSGVKHWAKKNIALAGSYAVHREQEYSQCM
jgi:hypothetical protein